MGLSVYIKGDHLFQRNITHNVGKMAKEAGLYEVLWRPEELGISYAEQMIVPLEKGLSCLHDDPEKYKKFNPENGWGSYESLVKFVEKYLYACRTHPNKEIFVER